MKAKPISLKIIITVAILTVLTLCVTSGFLYLIHVKSTKVVELHTLLNEEINLNASLDASRQVIKATEAEQEIINSYFIEEKNVVGFLEFLENLGREVGASTNISSVTTEKVINPKDKPKLAVAIHVHGDWTAVLTYMKLLEAVPYKVEINEVKVDALNAGELSEKSKPQWDGDIHIKTLMSL